MAEPLAGPAMAGAVAIMKTDAMAANITASLCSVVDVILALRNETTGTIFNAVLALDRDCWARIIFKAINDHYRCFADVWHCDPSTPRA